MSTVESLHYYPLTGARAIDSDSLFVQASGVVGDRQWVLYDPTVESVVKPRLSFKQLPRLSRLSAVYTLKDGLSLFDGDTGNGLSVSEGDASREVVIDEFGDLTPGYDCGDEAADYMSKILARKIVRLAEKSRHWLNESDVHKICDRKSAPIHIVNEDSVRSFDIASITSRRFRPNIVIKNMPAFEENAAVGKFFRIGSMYLKVTRLTARCPVPGYDPDTGENLKDVPKLYPQLRQEVNGKLTPVFGVYAVPVLRDSGTIETINKGDKVDIWG